METNEHLGVCKQLGKITNKLNISYRKESLTVTRNVANNKIAYLTVIAVF